MAKVRVKDEKSLEEAKEKLRGTVDFRKTKCGIVAAKSKRPKKEIKENLKKLNYEQDEEKQTGFFK